MNICIIKKLKLSFFYFLILLFTLSLCEILIRLMGYRPWEYALEDANEPTMNQSDPVLGWRTKEGIFSFPTFTKESKPIKMTFWKEGKRATRKQENYLEKKKKLVIVGGSITMGWSISDEETYPCKKDLAGFFPHPLCLYSLVDHLSSGRRAAA